MPANPECLGKEWHCSTRHNHYFQHTMMTKDEQCLAIADACGWKPRPSYQGDYQWLNPEGQGSWLLKYTSDLNAMHEAEKMLTYDRETSVGTFGDYKVELEEIVSRDARAELCATGKRLIPAKHHAFHATAEQRAEAFLRALGKWK